MTVLLLAVLLVLKPDAPASAEFPPTGKRPQGAEMSSIIIRAVAGLGAVVCMATGLMAGAAGTAHADEGEFEEPVVFQNVLASTSTCVSVNWEHTGQGVHGFSAVRKEPHREWKDIGPAQRNLGLVCDMQPNTTYRFEVCAHFITEDGDKACRETEMKTKPPEGQPPSSGSPTTPQIDISRSHAGPTFIGVRWDAFGYDYDSYFVNYRLKGAPPGVVTTIDHQDDGTWGYQRIDGLLPARAYLLGVQGCRATLTGDECFGWSNEVEISTHAYPLNYGPDTCLPPFVWREAFAGDKVCVDGKRRDTVKADNAEAAKRRVGPGCNTGPGPISCPFNPSEVCASPWVWREAGPADKVCVTWQERDLVRSENATAHERRAAPPK